MQAVTLALLTAAAFVAVQLHPSQAFFMLLKVLLLPSIIAVCFYTLLWTSVSLPSRPSSCQGMA